MIRPVITNFSSGELSPRMEGRVDLPMYSGGARELTNFAPERLGGVFKRGGLEYKINAPVDTGNVRLIPWSISDTVDIVLILYDNAIKILDVSAGIDPVYMTNVDLTDLTITTLDGSSGLVQSYDEEDIYKVKYAQNGSEITMVHPGYPAFFIKVIDVDTTNHTIVFEYGTYQFFGNVAYNNPISTEDEGDTIDSADLADALRNLVSGTTYTCDDSFVYVGATQYTVNSISITRVVNATQLKIYENSYLPTRTLRYTLTYDSTTFPHTLRFPLNFAGLAFGYYFTKNNDSCMTSGSTFISIITEIKNTIGSETNFPIAIDPTANTGIVLVGSSDVGIGYLSWAPGSYTIVINHTGGTLTLTSDSPQSIQCSITIESEGVSINGAKLSGSVLLDSIVPWMKRDKIYQCDQTMQLNGVTPINAQKTLVDGEEQLLLAYPNTDGEITITRETTGLIGQLGVIITPFYDSGDYPRDVCYHQGRLCLAGSGNMLYLSKPNDHSNFCYFEDIEFDVTSLKDAADWVDPLVPETRTDIDKTQQVGASSAMMLEIATDENEDIQWMVSAGDLVIGTSTTEWVMPADCNAMNARMVQVSRSGSASIQARFIGNSIISISPSRRVVRSYVPGSNTPPSDISEHAGHLFGEKIVGFDFRQDPHQEVFFYLEDGTAVRLVANSEVPAWSRIRTRAGDEIINIAVIRSYDEDAIYCVVSRAINGVDRYFIERLSTMDESSFSGRGYLDSSEYVASTGSGGTLSGFSRFGTETVNVAFRPSTGIEVRGTTTFTGGASSTYVDSITGLTTAIPINAEAWVGFVYLARLESFRIDSIETEGLHKGGGALHVRLYSSGVFTVKRGYEEVETGYSSVLPVTSLGVTIYPYSGAMNIEHDAPYGQDQSVVIESSDDQPVNILVIVPSYEVSGSP